MESLRNRIDQFCEGLETYDYCGNYGSYDDYGNGDGSASGEGFDDCSGFCFGYGSGSGDGCGFGGGSGFGDGFGDCSGRGSADGFCDGFGYNCRWKISQINNVPTKNIDYVLTAITAVRGNVAKGFIVHKDLSLEPCFIVKQDGYFAHGKTLRKALDALRNKIFESMPEEDRIRSFVESHELDQEYANRDFFEWHKKLTGSCEAGRMAFVRDHQIDLDGKMTTREFLELTKDSFGSNIIKKVEINYK